MERIEELKTLIAPTRAKLLAHPLYGRIQKLSDIQVFAQYHVFAVWDFMSLLKSLQIGLTCTSLPWIPKGSANTRYLINEIVTGEESDLDTQGNRTSHFEMYLAAMEQMGANQNVIRFLVKQITEGKSVQQALALCHLPAGVKAFVSYTFDMLESPLHVQASVFTFGREDLIPDMFLGLLKEVAKIHPEKLDGLIYYLERHIEVDGGHHSHLAMEMVSELCGENDAKWFEAGMAAKKSLEKRIELWDSILELI